MDEHRRWLNPSVDDYAVTYPEHADEIRESFPVLVALEQWKGNREISSLKIKIPENLSISKLGDCHIIREIRRNRTSILYEAMQGVQNHRVAMKLLPWKSGMPPRWREQYERETRLIQRLRHQHIVPLYTTGEDQGYCYTVMQLVAGVGLDKIITSLKENSEVNLKKIVQENVEWQLSCSHKKSAAHPKIVNNRDCQLSRNAWHLFAGIGLQIAKALQYSHKQGTLHNDIKPENILIDRTGHSWLTDFSLVQFAEGTIKQQSTESLYYKAPERFQEKNTEQSDLYSLGMVLYELTTLTCGFQTHDRNLLIENITQTGPVRPRELNPHIPAAFETIILNCIARSTTDRYQTASELRLDLVRFIKGTGVKNRAKQSGGSSRRWFGLLK